MKDSYKGFKLKEVKPEDFNPDDFFTFNKEEERIILKPDFQSITITFKSKSVNEILHGSEEFVLLNNTEGDEISLNKNDLVKFLEDTKIEVLKDFKNSPNRIPTILETLTFYPHKENIVLGSFCIADLDKCKMCFLQKFAIMNFTFTKSESSTVH